MTREHDRTAILQRERRHVRLPFGAHVIREGRNLQTVSAVAAALHRHPVSDVGGLRAGVLVAGDLFVRVAIPPRVLKHAVRVRKGARGNRGVAGAGEGFEVRIGGAPEPGALRHQAFQPRGPVGLKAVDVVCPHLIDDEDDSQLRSHGLR
jgi:hypothetical protein